MYQECCKQVHAVPYRVHPPLFSQSSLLWCMHIIITEEDEEEDEEKDEEKGEEQEQEQEQRETREHNTNIHNIRRHKTNIHQVNIGSRINYPRYTYVWFPCWYMHMHACACMHAHARHIL